MANEKRRYRIEREAITAFYADDLPNMATHCDQSKCGFSLYKGVLVQWDEDQDTRVLDFLDDMESSDRLSLLVVQEHEGGIAFLWEGYIPDNQYKEGASIEVDGDVWSIVESKCLPPRE